MKCENYIKSCFCLPRLPSPASLQFTKQIVMQSEKTNGQVFHHNCRGKVIFNWHVTNALLDSVMKQNRQYDLFDDNTVGLFFTRGKMSNRTLQYLCIFWNSSVRRECIINGIRHEHWQEMKPSPKAGKAD